jgi:release factor glutamine methyltransferase
MPVQSSIAVELTEGTRVLDRAGILNAKQEATAIWAALTGVGLGDVWLLRDEAARSDDSLRFREAVQRRASGEPLPYVVGVTGFRQLTLKVDPRVLIPRPETEGLVERVLDWAGRREADHSGGWGCALDVGTGSGAIALSLAVEGRFDRIVAIDISMGALDIARNNGRSLQSKTPVEFVRGALLDSIGNGVADVVVSNPPYVTIAEYAGLDASVSAFEPRDALVSGVDGLNHTRALLESAGSRLKPGGLIAIEVDSTRSGAVLDTAGSLGWRTARVEADLFGRPRFFLATKEI